MTPTFAINVRGTDVLLDALRRARVEATVVITGRSTVTRLADAAPAGPTRYTHVYVRQGGQWKLAAMQNSTIGPAQ